VSGLKSSGHAAFKIDRLAKDLKAACPDMSGFSLRNIRYMRTFAVAYPNEEIVQRCAAQLPWCQTMVVLDKIKDQEQRLWYISQSLKNGWSRDILAMQIDSDSVARALLSLLYGAINRFLDRKQIPGSKTTLKWLNHLLERLLSLGAEPKSVVRGLGR
jgi:hypothetical protein